MFKSNMWTLFNYGQISASFVYFRPFHTTIQMWIVKSIDRCCTWDSNTGTQDGGCRWIHLAMGAPRYWDKFFKICHSRPLFIYIRLFYKQLTLNNYSTTFRTWALWNQELPRCRLPQQLPTATTTADCHNNCPTGISYCLHFQKVKRLKWRQYFFIFSVAVERWCRLRGNLLFYFKSRDHWSEPAGVIVIEGCEVKPDVNPLESTFGILLIFGGGEMLKNIFFWNGPTPVSFSFISVHSNTLYIFYNK